MSGFPQLQAHLIGKGAMDNQRVTATPTIRHCKTCGLAVLAALADDGPQTPGVRVTLDPRPLTTHGELQALLAGHLTYHRTAGSIAWRDPVTIKACPADHADVFHTHTHPPPTYDRKPPPTGRTTPSSTDPTHIPY